MKNILINNTLFIRNTIITECETNTMNKNEIFYIVAPYLSEVCERALNNFIFLRYMWAPHLKIIGKLSFYDCKSLFRVDGDKMHEIGENAFYGCLCLSQIYLINVKICAETCF